MKQLTIRIIHGTDFKIRIIDMAPILIGAFFYSHSIVAGAQLVILVFDTRIQCFQIFLDPASQPEADPTLADSAG